MLASLGLAIADLLFPSAEGAAIVTPTNRIIGIALEKYILSEFTLI